jgi:septal ring factor EnvC (AmiA/AmiB activator)
MMDRLTPALEGEAADLARRLAELAAARALHAEGEAALAAGEARLGAAQATLAAAMTAAGALASNSPALTMMARNSESLSALAAALAGTGDAPPAPAEAGDEPLLWPVTGEILLHYDEPDAAGVKRRGIVLSAAPLALVRAPADAVVRYAGPFLEYGYVVVLAPDAETMLVLAGLAQLQVGTGAAVRRGDLLGLLGGRAPGTGGPGDDARETVMVETDTGARVGETLYIEVRHGRGPVDPEPLFAGENG